MQIMADRTKAAEQSAGTMRRKRGILAAALGLALVLGGCIPAVQTEGAAQAAGGVTLIITGGDAARFSARSGGSPGGSNRASSGAVYPPDAATLERLAFTLTLSGGPGGPHVWSFSGPALIEAEVLPGDWTVTVRAVLDGLPYAEGGALVKAVKGKSDSVTIVLSHPEWQYNVEDFGDSPSVADERYFTGSNSQGELQAWMAGLEPGNYIAHIAGTHTCGPAVLAPDVKVSLRGSGAISLSRNGSLFTVTNRAKLILRGPALQGRADNNASLVRVLSGGELVMRDGSIRDNKADGVGGGVYIGEDGTFTLYDGAISGNSVGGGLSEGGGVGVNRSNFTMHGGTISGNLAGGLSLSGKGGGVHVQNRGTFAMRDGVISGNKSLGLSGPGGGVYIASDANFTKSGGTIYGNDAEPGLKNTAGAGLYPGHAVYYNKGLTPQYRNATAGPDAALSTSGGSTW
jgi:hypothetical protein